MKKVFASLTAAGVLVAGAFVASTVTDSPAHAQTAEENTAGQVERQDKRPDKGSALVEALRELVDTGTISQSQADAVQAALEAKYEEIRENRPDRGERQRGPRRFGRQIAHLLEDGVISADEIAGLPDGHPFNNADGPLADELADGQITQEEWDAFKAERMAHEKAPTPNAP